MERNGEESKLLVKLFLNSIIDVMNILMLEEKEDVIETQNLYTSLKQFEESDEEENNDLNYIIQKEVSKIIDKLNTQIVLSKNSFDRDINFFDSENYFIHLLQQLNDFLLSAINSEKIGYSLIGFNMNYFPIIPSFLLTVIDFIDISEPFFRYLLFYIIDSIKSKDNTLSQANVKNMIIHYSNIIDKITLEGKVCIYS